MMLPKERLDRWIFSDEKKRFYFLPLYRKCLASCPSCQQLGRRAAVDRSVDEVAESLKKALSGNYQAVVLPCNAILHSTLPQILATCRDSGLPVILELNQALRDVGEIRRRLKENKQSIFAIHYLTKEFDFNDQRFLAAIAEDFPFYVSIVGERPLPTMERLRAIPEELRTRIFFRFPFTHKTAKQLLTPPEIAAYLKDLRREFPSWIVRPEPGVDTFEPLIPDDRNLEPILPPLWQQECATGPKEISVIIPTYNNRRYVINVLKHLVQQDIPLADFEIVLVDDGSDDGTERAVRERTRNEWRSINLTYLYLPRSKPRRMGDSQFRAGVARNFGVKNSHGRIIAFLDSDILVPPYYLRDLLEKHREYDVIQSKRVQLKPELSSEFTRYHEVEEGRDTYITDEGYWEKFQNETQDWDRIVNKWRFVCTYGLSFHRSNFERAGWIRKNYTFYGYEDTELGFNFARLGCRFHLSSLKVYHLDHRRERSEFFNSHHRKKLLLAHSAQTFYLNTLDSEVYRHLEWLFQPGLRWRVWLLALSGPFSIYLRPLYETMKSWHRQIEKRERASRAQRLRPLRKSYYFLDYQVRKRIIGDK